jgi:hypothetical protein
MRWTRVEKTVTNVLAGAAIGAVIEKMAKAKLAIYVGCGVMIAVAVQVPVARADSTDDRYIQLLMDEGQGIADRAPRDGLIKLGHLICDDMSHGKNPVEDENGLYTPADLSEHNRTLVGLAVGTYCPQYKDRIGG